MKTVLCLSVVLLMSTLAGNAYPLPSSAGNFDGRTGPAVVGTKPMSTTSVFVDSYNSKAQGVRQQSRYDTRSQLMYGNYTVPMAAKSIGGGETLAGAESGYRPMRRVIRGDDDNLRPGYDREDPFSTPVGDMPLLLLVILAAIAAGVRMRKVKNANLAVNSLQSAEEDA